MDYWMYHKLSHNLIVNRYEKYKIISELKLSTYLFLTSKFKLC